MFYHARVNHWQVIDVSSSLTVIHQDHDYSHLPGGQRHYHLPESYENIRLAGGRRTIFTLLDEPPEPDRGTQTLGRARGEVRFEQVGYRYHSQKAVSIGAYFVASGVYTVLGVMPHIAGSPSVVSLLTQGLKGAVNASFSVEPDPVKASVLISDHIERKRTELGI